MTRPLLFLAALALGASACDFAPTLDIDTPAFEPALTANGVLFADSTARIRITRARDPYATTSTDDGIIASVSDAVVTLQRDGGPAEALLYQPAACYVGFNPQTGQDQTVECGLYVSDVPIVGGAAYTLRAEAPGLPPVEAMTSVPARVPATATSAPGPTNSGLPTQRITLRFQDPPGETSYGLDALLASSYAQTQYCDNRGCRDSTYTVRFVGQTSFVTSDAILLAGLRGIPGTTNFVTFTDRLFAGQERSFTIDALVYGCSYDCAPDSETRRIVRLISFDGPLVEAYAQTYYSLGDGNPFQEPFDPVSNVRGGYGLIGAAAVTEIDLGTP